MKNQILYLLYFLLVLSLPFCTTTKKAAGSNTSVPAYTYTADVAPIIAARCTPCHFPETGKKKFLDTYGAVSSTIDEILHRVQLPQDSIRFMPFKAKKEPLSDSLIMVLQLWKEGGMAQ
jgi:hypothetical protein